jgi:protein tyrosine/serine phosphatase
MSSLENRIYTKAPFRSKSVMESTQTLKSHLQTSVFDIIDPAIISEILSKPPFITIPGSFNTRRLPLPNRAIYRTGSLEELNPEGSTAIRDDLKIRKIFDLRSSDERRLCPFPDIPGVEVIWLPNTHYNPTTISAQASSDNKPDPAKPMAYFISQYLSILTSHAPSIQAILRHILTSPPDSAFSFNCTAGKDRTGVVAYILLRLAGVSLAEIDLDYALTRIGVEPVREFLTRKVNGGKPLEMSDPRMQVAASIPFDAMTVLDGAVREKYGEEGVRAYLGGELGFEEGEVEKIVILLKG